jgi:hypothetical protein
MIQGDMEQDSGMETEARAVKDLMEKLPQFKESVKSTLQEKEKELFLYDLKVITEQMPPAHRDNAELDRRIKNCRQLLALLPKLDKDLQEIESLLEKAGVPIPKRSKIPPPSPMQKR